MPHGYHGRILHVHLAQMKLEVENPPDSFYRTYMGGSALGMYYMFKHTPAHADPLGPDNTLILSASIITGAPISGLSRLTVMARSPLSGAIGDSQSGGFFPAEMKFSGFDAVIVHGKADRPVYLWLKNGQAELRPASHLWGKTTGEVEDLIKEELGDDRLQVLQAGIAGENGVRFAALISMACRANGRTGMGAVMASKNLKAVAVRGIMRPSLSDPKGLNELARWGAKNFPDSDIYGMGLLGTAEVLKSQNKSGGLPTRNWSSGVFEGWQTIDGKTMADTILKKRETCYACTVRCKRVVEVDQGPYQVDPRYGGPEYETLATFGSYCGVDDLKAVARANQLCNQFGMDTISCGATIAWAMDCFEQGLLTREDTDGLDLRFGNHKAMVLLVEKIARREGFGNTLAEGSARAARKIGRGSDKLVVAVKNHDLPAHMPQVKRSLALIYAVNPFGADHQSHEHDPSYSGYPARMAQIGLTDPQPDDVLNEEKVRYSLRTELVYSAMDSLDVCQFVFGPAWQLFDCAQLVEAVRFTTGWDVTIDELLTVGERRLNLMRLFNIREGFTSKDDRLPQKLYQALKGGESDGIALNEVEFESARELYYQMAGWDKTGKPGKEKLAALKLDWAAELL